MLNSPIRVLLVDDHPMIRAGLAATISPEADMAIIGSAANGEEGVILYRQLKPDVTLMDLKMPRMGGVAAIRALRGEFPSAKIVVLSTYQGDEDIYRALEAGAATYVLKDVLADDLVRVIREVAGGGRPMPTEVAKRLAERSLQPSLTPREIDVLRLIAKGMRNKEIAADLRISEETAQGHVKNLFNKLAVHDRTAAVAAGVRRGIVHID